LFTRAVMNNHKERPDPLPQPQRTDPSSSDSSTDTPQHPQTDPELERFLRRHREAMGFT
jgi:hypothetical protein